MTRYPGYPVAEVLFVKGRGTPSEELGSVRIQHYGNSLRVASFLPGRDVCNEGDTPKTEPERSSWVTDDADVAVALFSVHLVTALRDGWSFLPPH